MSNQNPSGFISPVTQALYGAPGQSFGAPQVNTSMMGTWLGGDPGANPANNQGAQQSAIGMAQQTASGQGPSAAQAMLNQQNAKTQAATNALASSAPGRNQAGEARRNAMMLNSNSMNELGANAAVARAKEQLGGEALLGQESGEARAQDINSAQLAETAGAANANLQLGQNQLNQGAAEFNAQQNNQVMGQIAGLAAGAALAFADGDVGGGGASPNGDFQEPGGPAHWTIREEQNFILAVNQRTGQMYKLATLPLSAEEQKQAMAPHGAGPLGADDPRRQAKPMADGDLGARAPRAPTPTRTFADVVRMAHSGLYADGDVGPGQQDLLGPNAPTTSVNMIGNPAPYYAPDDTAGLSSMPSDSDVYYAQPGTNKEADYATANQLASNAPNLQSRQPQATGGYDQGWDDVIRSNGGSAPGDPDQPSQDSGGGNKFFKALGGALAGYSNPKNLSSLYGKQPVYQLQDTGAQSYHDGDLGAQLDQAHQYEQARIGRPMSEGSGGGSQAGVDRPGEGSSGPFAFRAPASKPAPSGDRYAKTGMAMGPVTVAPSSQTPIDAAKTEQAINDEDPVTKTSPVAEQERHGAYHVPLDPRVTYSRPEPNFPTSSMKDPYADLPQGLEPAGGSLRGNFSILQNEDALRGHFQKGQGDKVEFAPPEFGGLPASSTRTEEKPDRTTPPPWPTSDKRLRYKNGDPADLSHTTYMDADMIASSHPTHELTSKFAARRSKPRKRVSAR